MRNLVGEEAAVKLLNAPEDNYKTELQTCFKRLMTCLEEIVILETERVLKRFFLAGSHKRNFLTIKFYWYAFFR